MGLKDKMEKLIDIPHNFLERKQIGDEDFFIHRKGAASSDNDFIVKPIKSDLDHLYSIAHGAGRKWQRIMCKGKLGKKYDRETIKFSKYGSKVICNNRDLLFEEAPESYKNIEQVIDDLSSYGLIEKIAVTRPLLTVKL